MKKRLIPFAAVAVIMASCSSDDVLEVNPEPLGQPLSFNIAVGHTRATETKLENLGDFAVVARGMHHDGVLYDSFLIGSGTAGDVATRKENSSIWTLDHDVFWPSTFEQVMFFAYTTLKTGETGNVLYGDASFGFENKNPFIKDYAPKKADLTVRSDEENAVWADGLMQKDLLVAYTKQERTDGAVSVSLNFKHALTQISITAKQKNKTQNDHRIVKIKGAWIVNAAESGKLVGNLNYNPADQTTDDTQSWTASAGKTAYGSFYNQIITLDKDKDTDLLRPEGSSLGSLMLVPEDLTGWTKKSNDATGAYILLLCRVELQHTGATHTTEGDGEVDMSDIYTDGTNHYHQLFPVNTTEYNAAQYGFVCVPLSSQWNTEGMGKHYTYNLDICGAKTGAGFYPPVISDNEIKKLIPEGAKVGNKNLEVVAERPVGKKIGDEVLDAPIQFEVIVSPWDGDDDKWKPGIDL